MPMRSNPNNLFQRISTHGIFRGYRSRTLAENGLMLSEAYQVIGTRINMYIL